MDNMGDAIDELGQPGCPSVLEHTGHQHLYKQANSANRKKQNYANLYELFKVFCGMSKDEEKP